MSTMPVTQQVRWQDLIVRNEVEIVLEIAQQAGWKDCEIFGFGGMITEPRDSFGWKLIPADLYKYSIPAEGVRRVHQVINAGIRIQGIIIADDERNPEPSLKPARPKISLPSVKPIVSMARSWISNALTGLIRVAAAIVGVIAIVSLVALALKFLVPFIVLGFLILVGSITTYDPKLIILVDDGNGGTVWISLFTWYE